ncbi:MAG: hypothetical protein KA780_02490 [Prolixibacteraceae bacterium]|jgi:hypothetical protein|nr:hypothetical protein [Prolixibacteraceae bacterium]NLX30040.1 TonB-dependent receptor [Bacteroidales bacterium]HNQ37633.1 DUF5777 family beta-barrel protein [Prolixibacteraceae bacterium]HPJ78380.1 DUF5777 family beta-barrel protein [Prolixibacteraceae bacterium]HRV88353.1 DUF5777 family beta-barrel protein [Prolixibacteraceae bacterium]
MKKIIIFLLLVLPFCAIVMAQDETTEPEAPVRDRPVRSPWESGYLIDNPTSLIPVKNTLEFVIQHKFGTIENGRSDLWGLYAAGSNIRLGLNYVLFKNFQVGWGITKKNMYNDFSARWTLLEQTRANRVPVSVTLYGVMAIDGRSQEYYDGMRYNHSSDPYHPLTTYSYRPGQRLSYFSQLLIGRKFSERLSLQAGASFTHYNLVARTGDHDKIGAHLGGRFKFSPQSSLIFNYDVPLKIKNISEQREWIAHPKENLALGLEVSTSTHAFQIYLGTADGIIPQDQMLFNQNDWKDKGLAVGFVITRLWNF